MTSPRRALAVSLAAATIAVILVVIAMVGARAVARHRRGRAGHGFVCSSAGRGVISGGRPAGNSGMVGLVYGLVATGFLAAATFPSPVFGIIMWLPVLGLGVAKGVETARAGRR
jgi:hypothetical protein